jgi:dienelactone hydrolase
MYNGRMKIYLLVVMVAFFLLSACGAGQSPIFSEAADGVEVSELSFETQAPTATVIISPSETLTATHTWTPAWTATLTFTHTSSPTPDPYRDLTVEGLASRSYGDGELVIREVLAENSAFTRYLISYPSDGLTIYGFMNVPHSEPPFPVVIASHGYIDPKIYRTLDYTTGYADALARAGYMVIHPNLRNYPPSDEGPNLFRVGMAVDVLNLIALVQSQGGINGTLEMADPGRIGLWGHSMGGGVSTRVMTVNPGVRAVVLYGAMSGDERQNFEAILDWSDGERGMEELNFPEDELLRISPIYHLDRIQSAVSIHHGRSDELVPLAWSVDLCERLQNLEKMVECYIYDGQPHTFYGDGNDLFIQRSIEFYDRFLRD